MIRCPVALAYGVHSAPLNGQPSIRSTEERFCPIINLNNILSRIHVSERTGKLSSRFSPSCLPIRRIVPEPDCAEGCLGIPPQVGEADESTPQVRGSTPSRNVTCIPPAPFCFTSAHAVCCSDRLVLRGQQSRPSSKGQPVRPRVSHLVISFCPRSSRELSPRRIRIAMTTRSKDGRCKPSDVRRTSYSLLTPMTYPRPSW